MLRVAGAESAKPQLSPLWRRVRSAIGTQFFLRVHLEANRGLCASLRGHKSGTRVPLGTVRRGGDKPDSRMMRTVQRRPD